MAARCIEGEHENDRVQRKNTSNPCRVYDEKVAMVTECDLGEEGGGCSRNQNDGIGSVKWASMNAHAVQTLEGTVRQRFPEPTASRL